MKGRNQTEPTAQKTEFTFGVNSTKCPPQVRVSTVWRGFDAISKKS